MSSRAFSGPEFVGPPRTIDNAAPDGLRQEFVGQLYWVAEGIQHPVLTPIHLYRVIGQSMGGAIAANPYGGVRYATGRDILRVEWPRFFDVVVRVAAEFLRHYRLDEYRDAVNPLLAAHGIVWNLDEHGSLVRVLPQEAAAGVAGAIEELSAPQFIAGRQLFDAAREA